MGRNYTPCGNVCLVAEDLIMGAWYLCLGASLTLIFIGLYTHWIVILCGALLPFVPLVTYVLQRRRQGVSEEN